MGSDQNKQSLRQYPIQPNFIAVKELYIKTLRPPHKSINTQNAKFTFESGYSEYDIERKVIQVGGAIEIKEQEGIPFVLKINLVAEFSINEDYFPKERVVEWASKNAPFILFPFFREHVFSLTSRCGFDPFILPLVEVPTLKIELTAPSPEVVSS